MNALPEPVQLYLAINITLVLAWLVWRAADYINTQATRQQSFIARLTTARFLLVLSVALPLSLHWLPVALAQNIAAPAQNIRLVLDAIPLFDNAGNEVSGARALTGSSISFTEFLLGVFVTVFALLSIRLARRIRGLKQIICRSYKLRSSGKLTIYYSSDIKTPFSTRLFGSSQIVIPESLLAHPKYLSAVLAHEGQHLRNGDTVSEIMMEFVQLLFFCNPVIYRWKSDLSSLQEFACDETLLRKRKITAGDYSQCLLYFAELVGDKDRVPVASTNMSGTNKTLRRNGSQLRRRIEMIVQETGFSATRTTVLLQRYTLFILVALTALITSASFSTAFAQTEQAKKFRLEAKFLAVNLYQDSLRESLSAFFDASENRNLSYEELLGHLQEHGEAVLIANPEVLGIEGSPTKIMFGLNNLPNENADSLSPITIEVDLNDPRVRNDAVYLTVSTKVSRTIVSRTIANDGSDGENTEDDVRESVAKKAFSLKMDGNKPFSFTIPTISNDPANRTSDIVVILSANPLKS